MHDAELDVARSYLRWSGEAPRARRGRRRAEAPVDALQVAALSDPDPFRRAGYLALLDHIANDASTHVFAAALRDPVADVRRHAVHGLTCERCRRTDVCLTDVVPAVIAALADEPTAEVRHQLVVVLGQFVTRSRKTLERLERSASRRAVELR